MVRYSISLILVFFLLTLALPSLTQKRPEIPVAALAINKTYKGKSIKVDDGDTFTFLDAQQRQYKIRLEGIDAPEKGMPFSKKSKLHLAALLQDQVVNITVTGYDQYKRVLARVSVNKININAAMIHAGMAWHFKKHSNNDDYDRAEQQARKNRIGLWQERSPLAPWTVRAYRRAGYTDARFLELRKQNSVKVKRFLMLQ